MACTSIYLKRKTSLDSVINKSIKESDLIPTYIEVYDNSTPERADRLFIIMPFQFILLNHNRNLYVLDPYSPIKCSPNQATGVKMMKDRYQATCLTSTLNSIMKVYKRYPKQIIYYDIPIDTKTFTIFSTINILFDHDLIDLDEEVVMSDHQIQYDHELLMRNNKTQQSFQKNDNRSTKLRHQYREKKLKKHLINSEESFNIDQLEFMQQQLYNYSNDNASLY